MTRPAPPLDPRTRQLIRMARGGLSRRAFLGGVGAAGAGLALAACAPPQPPAAGGAASLALPKDLSASQKVCNWANWTAYLDQDDAGKTYPTLDAFIKKTGMKVSYFEEIDDNSTYFNKVAPQLRAGQDINRDIVVFTDWMANRVIREQLCQPLELIAMPNASNLLPKLQDVPFDPGRNFSLTWQSGFAGIGYDKSKVKGKLTKVSDLWQPALKGKIVALSEFRDTVGLILLEQGVDISKDISTEQFQKAVDVVSEQIGSGQIRRIRGNSYLEDLKSGNAIAGIVWSGDLFVLQAETENPNWEFVIPDAGGTLWSDNMMIPITSQHRRNAERLMDYYYQPDVAAQVAAWVNYVCPVEGAQEAMRKIDADLAKSPFIFPDDEFLAKRVKVFAALAPEKEQEFTATWEKVIGN